MIRGRIHLISNGFGLISSSDRRGTAVFEQNDVIEGSFESPRPRQMVEHTPVKRPTGWSAPRVRVLPHAS